MMVIFHIQLQQDQQVDQLYLMEKMEQLPQVLLQALLLLVVDFKQLPDDLSTSCQGGALTGSPLGTTCASTYNTGSSYNVPPSSYTYNSSPYNNTAVQPPLKFAQSSASYIRVSESIVDGLNGSSGYDSNFMIKEEPWDQPTGDAKSNFVSTPLQLHFNDSPYTSPNNKSDKSSVHSPSDCLVSPFTSPTPHFSFDNTTTSPAGGYLVSHDYPPAQIRDTTPLHLNVSSHSAPLLRPANRLMSSPNAEC